MLNALDSDLISGNLLAGDRTVGRRPRLLEPLPHPRRLSVLPWAVERPSRPNSAQPFSGLRFRSSQYTGFGLHRPAGLEQHRAERLPHRLRPVSRLGVVSASSRRTARSRCSSALSKSLRRAAMSPPSTSGAIRRIMSGVFSEEDAGRVGSAGSATMRPQRRQFLGGLVEPPLGGQRPAARVVPDAPREDGIVCRRRLGENLVPLARSAPARSTAPRESSEAAGSPRAPRAESPTRPSGPSDRQSPWPDIVAPIQMKWMLCG